MSNLAYRRKAASVLLGASVLGVSLGAAAVVSTPHIAAHPVVKMATGHIDYDVTGVQSSTGHIDYDGGNEGPASAQSSIL
jgi:hypothetical protein